MTDPHFQSEPPKQDAPSGSAGAPRTMKPTELRLRLFERGYSPLPLNGKIPAINEWQKHHETNEEEIRVWGELYP